MKKKLSSVSAPSVARAGVNSHGTIHHAFVDLTSSPSFVLATVLPILAVV